MTSLRNEVVQSLESKKKMSISMNDIQQPKSSPKCSKQQQHLQMKSSTVSRGTSSFPFNVSAKDRFSYMH